jgi:protease I
LVLSRQNLPQSRTGVQRRPKMSKIAIILTDLFEDVEYVEPAEALQSAGHELVHVGIKEGETVKGRHKETRVKIDKSAKDVSVDEFDAVLIPRGQSADTLRADRNATQFIWEFMKKGKPVLTSRRKDPPEAGSRKVED